MDITVRDVTFEVAATGLHFPEGPVAMRDGSVLVVEVRSGNIVRVLPDGDKRIVAEAGGGPNGAAIGPDGALYVCNNGGHDFDHQDDSGLPYGELPASYTGGSIQRVDLASGAVTTLYDKCGGAILKAPNDLVFDRSGGFWFSDFARVTNSTIQWGAVYYAQPDGSHIQLAVNGLLTPNGVGLSPDETTLYVAETFTGRLLSFRITGPGTLQPTDAYWQRGTQVGQAPEFDLLDSLAIEAGGAVCVASLARGGITLFEPTGGSEFLALPADTITNICFGGPDMRDAWITAGASGTLYRTRWPRPGLALAFNA